MATAAANALPTISPQEYKRRIQAWTMYDWANSAFATTILAAVLPVYFSQVAGATLPSATVATTYWSTGLSLSLFIIAIISPILGTVSDVMRGKKRFLAIFAGIGIISTALLVLVETGDWVLASILGIIGRIGFSGANTFYDALLPHVAKSDDQDRVSARGYAMGYLGGGLLLAVNVVMIQLLPGTWGARLSFLSVAIWWAVFSIPILRRVPEPPAASVALGAGETVWSASFKRMADTLSDIRRYRELFKYLVSFLIYNDGIGTIIGVAAIYGAELGFGAVELILALLLVQFVGIPYSLIFGRLPSPKEKRRPVFLAFVLFNLVALPLAGVTGKNLLPEEITGIPPLPFTSTPAAVGEGLYLPDSQAIQYTGNWQAVTIPAEELGSEANSLLNAASEESARFDFTFNGQRVEITYSLGPDHGIWEVWMDGQPLLDPESGQPLRVDAYNPTTRYEVSQVFQASEPGQHTLSLVNTSERNPDSQGSRMTLSSLKVLPKARQSNLGAIIGLIVGVELLGLALSFALGPRLFANLAASLDTRRSILLALAVYCVVAIWAFFLNSTIEYWFMAWMVAIVQGGSQALSRSLYAALSPAAKSGEFFGLFGVMEKFSAFIGPLFFAAAGAIFGSSRPAVLSLVAFFFLGGYLLTRVNVEEGKRIAQLEDAELLHKGL
ncbi:MAG: MFS transporter [Anaerolineales bacterium]|nr:MFS transporter [Anaerolineales bacterium]